ncbi:MAG TPA: zf-TFIIB domain-containing protein [Solirubrobacteraceae bacterium]|nr:zf-TFIIB domain-containing protein [Solirubrobacteraceae bacterium]
MQCPSCSGPLVEFDRSGVRVDACRQCRGVWLDRGELDRIVERERSVVAGVDEDEQDFVREMTGNGKSRERQYGLDPKSAQHVYDDYRQHRKQKKRKSFLDELFD